MSGCPHSDVRFCPLYVAAHVPHLPSCADGRLDEGGCAVDRGLDYAEARAALPPRLVAELRFHEEAEDAAAQRARNMRLNGIH